MKKIFLIIFLSWLIFFIIIPPLHTPDETEHYENSFWVSKFIYPYEPKDKTKPRLFSDRLGKGEYYRQDEIKKLQPITLQSYHPPLYYFYISFSHHISNFLHLDLLSRFYLTRLFSSFLYFGYVIIAYKILKLLFTSEIIITGIFLFFSLNPLVVKSAVGINPDTGLAFFSLLFLYLLLKWQVKKSIDLKKTIILAIIASLTTLNKFSGIFTALVFPLYIYINKGLNKKTFFNFFIFYVLFFILLSPWFYLNFTRYGKLSPPAFHFAEYRELQPHNFIQSVFLSAFEFRHTIMHYSGFLGPRNDINPPKIFFAGYTILIFIFSMFGFFSLLKNLKNQKKFLLVLIHFFSLTFFLFILGVYFKKEGFSWDLQGRYFIPGFFSLAILIYFGLKKFFNNQKLSALLLYFFSLTHILYILLFILIPAYYH